MDDLPEESWLAFAYELLIDLVVVAFKVAQNELNALIVDFEKRSHGILVIDIK